MGTSDVKRNSLRVRRGGPSVTDLSPYSLAQGLQPKALPEVDGLLLRGALSTACSLLDATCLYALGLPFLGAAWLDSRLRVSWGRGQRGDGPRGGWEAGG